jgi:quercetin dioxygenase-like cupin family protein
MPVANAGTEGPAARAPMTNRVEKPWGWELWWAVTDRYVGKVLFIEAGKRLSLQYHNFKDESIYVMDGKLLLHIGDESGELTQLELGPGEYRRVPALTKHRYEAIEDTHLLEVSTPELDDVVRLEDDYGREGTSAP